MVILRIFPNNILVNRFLVSDITFPWDHPLAFRRIKSPRERTKKLIYILS